MHEIPEDQSVADILLVNGAVFQVENTSVAWLSLTVHGWVHCPANGTATLAECSEQEIKFQGRLNKRNVSESTAKMPRCYQTAEKQFRRVPSCVYVYVSVTDLGEREARRAGRFSAADAFVSVSFLFQMNTGLVSDLPQLLQSGTCVKIQCICECYNWSFILMRLLHYFIHRTVCWLCCTHQMHEMRLSWPPLNNFLATATL